MRPWEKRLRDLAQLLRNCESSYFDPDRFRMNTNQFVQTARTVTFIIQKNKNSIPGWDPWYEKNVVKAWAGDAVMQWAKDSRNTIEKEGDLDLHSSLAISLIFSYIEEQDVSIPSSRAELVGANIKRLIRFARQKLPTGTAADAVVKIERRWVANSLATWELLNALRYIYHRLYECCADLARYLGDTLDDSIPHSTNFDDIITDARNVRYVELSNLRVSSLTAKSVSLDVKGFVPPPEVAAVFEERKSLGRPRSLHDLMDYHAKMAVATFQHHGNHEQMLFLYDDDWQLVDFVGARFGDQADKYIFWRNLADRIAYLKAGALVWVSESWLRKVDKLDTRRMKDNPIIGESMHVIGLDHRGDMVNRRWTIKRGDDPKKVELAEVTESGKNEEINFLIPARKAFSRR